MNSSHLESPTLLATSTALFGLALKLLQDGVALLPILAALLGGLGTCLVGLVSVSREIRAWRDARSTLDRGGRAHRTRHAHSPDESGG